MRLFVSINFDAATTRKISRSAAALRDYAAHGTYVPSENYHVTLAFLGECERSVVDRLVRAMDEAGAGRGPFDVTVGGVDFFEKDDGKIVYVPVDGGKPLGELHDALLEALARNGFVLPADEKKDDYVPHVTLARKVLVRRDDLGKIREKPFVCRVEGISLMLSSRVRGQMSYREMYRVSLQ